MVWLPAVLFLAQEGPEELIRKLGDENPAKREDATAALAALGEPVLAALRAVRSSDPEVRFRAKALVRRIEEEAGFRARLNRWFLREARPRAELREAADEDFYEHAGWSLVFEPDPERKLETLLLANGRYARDPESAAAMSSLLLPGLLWALRYSREWAVVHQALGLLGALGDLRAADAIRASCKNKNVLGAQEALMEIERRLTNGFRPVAWEPLEPERFEEGAQSPDPVVRTLSIRALAGASRGASSSTGPSSSTSVPGSADPASRRQREAGPVDPKTGARVPLLR